MIAQTVEPVRREALNALRGHPLGREPARPGEQGGGVDPPREQAGDEDHGREREQHELLRRWLALAAADESRLSALAAAAEASELERARLEAELKKTVEELALERRL